MIRKKKLGIKNTIDSLSFLFCTQGRPTEAMQEIDKPEYGKSYAKDYLPGAEILDAGEKSNKKRKIAVSGDKKSERNNTSEVENNEDDSENEGNNLLHADRIKIISCYYSSLRYRILDAFRK